MAVPRKIRMSIGTASVLGLMRCSLLARPTTAYLMLYIDGRCRANCGFCPQARSSSTNTKFLSRVVWPPFEFEKVLHALKRCKSVGIRRICVQTLNYDRVVEDTADVVSRIHEEVPDVPISVSIQPISEEGMRLLKESGIERISIPVDAATPELFEKVKGSKCGGPYRWDRHMRAIETALRVFGTGSVSTHLIIGLGETEREAVEFIQKMTDMGVLVGLFAFTPIRGTRLEKLPPPPVDQYRRVQIARYIIVHRIAHADDMEFSEDGRIVSFGIDEATLKEIVESGRPFMTSGCPHCNRPFYNESPRGPIYNYPYPPSRADIVRIKRELGWSGNQVQ